MVEIETIQRKTEQQNHSFSNTNLILIKVKQKHKRDMPKQTKCFDTSSFHAGISNVVHNPLNFLSSNTICWWCDRCFSLCRFFKYRCDHSINTGEGTGIELADRPTNNLLNPSAKIPPTQFPNINHPSQNYYYKPPLYILSILEKAPPPVTFLIPSFSFSVSRGPLCSIMPAIMFL